jgi:hypothetical protein
MSHLARIFFIAFASVAASCSAERAQQESDKKEIARQLNAAYYSCVRTSFASMLPTMVDRNMGIEQAFRVCRSEESKLQALQEARMSALTPWRPTAIGSKKNSCGDSGPGAPRFPQGPVTAAGFLSRHGLHGSCRRQ